MRTEMFIKSYRADAAVAKHRIVKAGAADGNAAQASAAADAIIGVADSLGATAAGQVFDVVTHGYATVQYGGNVTRGAPLTADANGKAVVAAPAVGANVRLIGFAVTAGVADDLGTVDVRLGVMQG